MIYSIGDAIISPLAWTSSDNLDAVLRGESRLQYYENLFGLPDPCFVSLIDPQDVDDRFAQLPTRTEERYTKVEKMAILAAAQALEQAHLDAAREDVLFIISTTKGNVDLLSGNPYEPQRVYLWRTAQLIADYFGNPNTPMVVSNACISGCAAQLAAINQLRFGTYNYAVVVGAETLSKFVISGFQSFKALSKERCKPFDANRVGLNLGEAAAAMVYTIGEDDATLPDGTLLFQNGAISNDSNHISGPSRTAEGLLRAINKSIANFDTNRIAFLNAHGTATPYNDDMESIGVNRAGLQAIPVNSLKGYYGHTLGAAGVLETILSAHALRNRCVLRCNGTDTPGTVNNVNVPLQTAATQGDSFMKLISGFGGSNAAMLFTVTEEHTPTPSHPIDASSSTYQTLAECRITNDDVVVNGETVMQRHDGDDNWLATIYRSTGMQYPKFFKMDRLCKIGTLAAELLLKDIDFNREEVKPNWAIVLMNSASSLDDDRQYQTTIKDAEKYYPSPAVFVYTLANIVTGEIAIRHKIGGESSFYVFQSYNEEQLDDLIGQTFQANPELTHIVCGWVDYDQYGGEVRMKLALKH